MQFHERAELPEDVYPIDDWTFAQARYDPAHVAQAETIFALSNGYLGMRGGFEEGRPCADDGTLVNGFYEFRPISYPEEAYGHPHQGQTILYVPEAKIIRLYVDGEPVDLCNADIQCYRRVLDMRAGVLERAVEFRTLLGKRVRVRSTRMVSFRRRHLAAIAYEVTLLEGAAEVDVSSELCLFRPEAAKTPIRARRRCSSTRC